MFAFAGKFLASGLMTHRELLRTAYAQTVYHLGKADHQQTERLRKEVSRLVTGWEVAKVNAIAAQTLHEVITPQVFAEALKLIEQHHQAGRDVIIVSASGWEIVAPIARMLGADQAIATRMQIAHGRYTGHIEFYCYGEAKAEKIQHLADAEGYNLDSSYAYSDSVTDLPMLHTVGHPAVVNPDRALRREALEQGWDVLNFAKPVSLRPIYRKPRAIAGIGVGVGLAILGATLWTARRNNQG